MQSEEKHLEFIVQFESGGPNNYAYRLIAKDGEKTLCKFITPQKRAVLQHEPPWATT